MGVYVNSHLGFAPVIAAAPAAGPAAPLLIAGAGIATLFASLFGFGEGGRRKKETAEIADDGFPLLRNVRDQFLQGQLTKAQALVQLDAIWQQMVKLWREYDRLNGGSRGAAFIVDQRRFFDQIRNRVLRGPEQPPIRGLPSGAAPDGAVKSVLPWLAVGAAAYFLA